MQLLIPHEIGNFSKTTFLSLTFVYISENDVDGETLLKLTENMVARLLPSMKLQVKFIELQEALNATPTLPSPCVTLSSSNSTHSQSAIDSSASQQYGCVSQFVGYILAM